VTMSLDQMATACRVTAERLAGHPAIPAPEAERITALMEGKLAGMMRSRMRSSFANGDWSTFEQAAEFMARRGSLSSGKRLGIFLARRRDRLRLPLAAVQGFLRLRTRLRKTLRCLGGAFATVEDVVRLYSADDRLRSQASGQ